MTENPNPIRDEYLRHIEKQRDSGLSIKKYCEQNNLVDHKFTYYRDYKLKAAKKRRQNSSSFVPVKVVDQKFSKGTGPIDPVWLAQFIKALQS